MYAVMDLRGQPRLQVWWARVRMKPLTDEERQRLRRPLRCVRLRIAGEPVVESEETAKTP